MFQISPWRILMSVYLHMGDCTWDRLIVSDKADRACRLLVFSRRDSLKAMLLFGAAVLFLPILVLAQFLFAPRETRPVTYPKVRIVNSKDVPINESVPFE